MRRFRVVVAAVVLLVITAWFEASTASATRLCATNTSPCSSIYPSDTTFTFTTTVNATLTTSGSPVGVNPTIPCHAHMVLTSTGAGGGPGTPVPVAVTGLTATNCESSNPTGCGTTATIGSLAGATGDFIYNGANSELDFTPPTITVHCPILGMNVACTFGGSGTLKATVTNGNPAILHMVNQSIAATGGFGCPTAAVINARFSSNKALFITNS